jgi:5'-3' exonuclease
MTNNIILIDTSYTAFYRFFATLRWFSFAFPEEFKTYDSTYDWATNKIFMEKYEKMFLKSIIDLIKKKVFDNSKIIFCMDSPKESLWRTIIDTTYKGNRMDMSLKNNFKPTFAYTFNTMIPNFIKNNDNIYGMRIDCIEADDIIAILSMHLQKEDNTIYIVSGDADFLQLGCDKIKFVNYKHKKPFSLTECEAIVALKTKLIMGDKSDGINSIFPKGSRVKKQELIDSEELLQAYLDKNPGAKTQYEFNCKMIDFKNIPKKYITKTITLFNKII